MRRATGRHATLLGRYEISIHALHEESDYPVSSRCEQVYISIHALHEESDQYDGDYADYAIRFQSTLSMRRATIAHVPWYVAELISIHALHEESNPILSDRNDMYLIFQSTLSMRRATSVFANDTTPKHKFQSTLSMRRATQYHSGQTVNLSISIHALHEESDNAL